MTPPVMWAIALLLLSAQSLQAAELLTNGERWDTHELIFQGPLVSETGTPNPFLDFRLDVRFIHPVSGALFVVPGFFDADGKAAESGASSGRVWTVRFTPSRTGTWMWSARFIQGRRAALSGAGKPAFFNNERGEFTVRESSAKAPDLRSRGRLQYVGQRYFQFADGTRHLKLGTNTPENLLGYADFDGAKARPRHDFAEHVKDWRRGDPTWRGGKGKGLIGAVNYLHANRVNSLFSLLMTVRGDSFGDVHPWVAEEDVLHFDVSKLAQWQIVFDHATKKGITLNLSFLETENEALFEHLANASTSTGFADARKLFYREMVARFAHNIGYTMTLGEENGWNEIPSPSGHAGHAWGYGNTPQQRAEFTHYLRAIDPYDSPILVHTFPPEKNKVYEPLLTYPRARVEAASLQMGGMYSTNAETALWLARSAERGRQWVVTGDEFHTGMLGKKIGGIPMTEFENDVDSQYRGAFAWGNVLAGGAGIELYTARADQSLDDFRELEWAWREFARVRTMFERHNVPFWAMASRNDLIKTKGARMHFCLARPGEVYVAYIDGKAEEAFIDLFTVKTPLQVRWYSPRPGESTNLQVGSISQVNGGTKLASPGAPPGGWGDLKDWVLVVARALPFDATAKSINMVSPRDLIPGAMTLGRQETWS